MHVLLSSFRSCSSCLLVLVWQLDDQVVVFFVCVRVLLGYNFVIFWFYYELMYKIL